MDNKIIELLNISIRRSSPADLRIETFCYLMKRLVCSKFNNLAAHLCCSNTEPIDRT